MAATNPSVYPHPPGPAQGILPEANPSVSPPPDPSARAAAAAMDGEQQGDVTRAPALAQSGPSGPSGPGGNGVPSGPSEMEVEQAPLVGPGSVKQEKDGSGGG